MTQRKKYWVWLLLLIPFCIVVLYWLFSPHDVALQNETTPPVTATRPPLSTSMETATVPFTDAHFLPFPKLPFPKWNRPVEGQNEGHWTMRGTVRSDEGQLLAGATVSLHASGPQAPDWGWSEPIIANTCDNSGRYLIEMDSPLSQAAIAVRKEGYGTLRASTEVKVPDAITKDFVMIKAPACLEGTVYEGDTKIAGAQLHAFFPSGPRINSDTVTSDDLGKYRFQNLATVYLLVYADKPGFIHKETYTYAVKNAPPGQCGKLDFKLVPATLISFQVKNQRGEPISGAYIETREDGNPRFGETTKITWAKNPDERDADGNVTEAQIPFTRSDKYGKVALNVDKEQAVFDCKILAAGYKSAIISIDTTNPPSQIILEELTNHFTGVVTAENGDPVGSAVIQVYQSPNAVEASNSRSTENGATQAKTDLFGRFSVPLTYPHVTAIWVTKEGFSEKRLTYAAGQSLSQPLQIRLERCNTGIYGTITDFEGKPAAGFRMIFTDVGHPDRGSYLRDFQTDDGRFIVNDIEAGVYDIFIQRTMPDSVQNLRITNVELKKGYLCGEINAQLKVVAIKKFN